MLRLRRYKPVDKSTSTAVTRRGFARASMISRLFQCFQCSWCYAVLDLPVFGVLTRCSSCLLVVMFCSRFLLRRGSVCCFALLLYVVRFFLILNLFSIRFGVPIWVLSMAYRLITVFLSISVDFVLFGRPFRSTVRSLADMVLDAACWVMTFWSPI